MLLSWLVSPKSEPDGMRGCVGFEDHHVKRWALTMLIAYSTFRTCMSQQMEGNQRVQRAEDTGEQERDVSRTCMHVKHTRFQL